MEGGELFERIQDRQDGAFTERGKGNEFIVIYRKLVSFITTCLQKLRK